MSAAPPTITSVLVTGAWITVDFADPASGSYTSYAVTLQAPAIPGLAWTFPSVPATGPLIAQMSLANLSPPFDSAQAYTVTVAGSPGGPTSSPFTVPASSPALSSVTVTPSAISIAWSDALPPTGVSSYTATLWQGSNGFNFPDVAAGLPMVATMAPPAGGLEPSLPYTVSVTSFTSAGPAMTSAALAVISAAASCTTALSTDTRTLTLTAPVPPTSPAWNAFSFQLIDGDMAIASTAGVTPAASMPWSLASPLQAGRSYSVAVAGQLTSAAGGGSTSLGLFGPATPVIVGAPVIVGTPTFDGAVLKVAWTRVAEPAVRGYLVTVSGADSLTFVTGLATTLVTPAVITGAAQVTVAAIGAASTGPAGTPVAITQPTVAAPLVLSAVSDGRTLSVDWTPVATAGVIGYQVMVGTGPRFTTGLETSLTVPVTFTLASGLSVSVAPLTASGLGPASAALPITVPTPAGTPTVTSAWWDGRTLFLNWTPVVAYGAVGYAVTVEGGGTTLRFATSGDTALAVPVSLAPGATWTATVAAFNAVGTQGPASSPASVVTAAPELTSVQYAPGTISAAWTVASPPSGASYELALFDGGALISSTTSGTSATGGTLPATLVPGRSYTVRSRILAGLASGPWSGTGAIITTAPTVLSTLYDGSSVAVTWTALVDPSITGYLATLAEVGGSVVGTPVASGTSSALIPAPGVDPGKSYQVTVQAMGNTAVGPASTPAAAVVESVAPTSAAYDGGFLTLSWGAAKSSGATYLVEVWAQGAVVASQESAQPTVTFAAPLSGSTACTATVRVRVGVASGAPGTAVALLTGATFVNQGSTDAMTGLTTFSWAPLPGASSYLFQPYLGGLPSEPATTVTGTTYTYPVALFRDSDFSLAVAGVSSVAGVKVTGPYGPMYYPPTLQPVIGNASYDGVNASISWGFVSGSTGYRVSVLQSGQSQPISRLNVTPTINSVVFSPTITDPTQTYGVIVQSMVGSDTGPPSAQAPLFTAGFYVSASPATTYAPFVYPSTTLALVSSATLGQSGVTAVLYLPNLSSGPPLTAVPPQGAFALGQNTDPSTKTLFPYKLTIAGSSEAWAFSPSAIRTTLQSDYETFLKNLETAGAAPAGIATVQQAISRYMPQTFQETLYYAYGFDLANHSIDLRPGMVLRVALGDYVTVPDSSISQWMDGYVGGPVVDYEVGSYVSGGNWLAGFDAFIAQLTVGGALTVSEPPLSGTNQGGVADGADLFFEDFTAPFYRLFFPGPLQTPTGQGSVVPGNNFAIAAAASYTALTDSSSTPSETNFVAYFRGRAVVRLCIRVTVNGAQWVVPIGTTVGNLLDRYGWRPPSTGVGLDGFTLQRSLGPVTLEPGKPFDVGQSYAVRLDWKALAIYAPWQDALELPLLHGDVLTVTG